VQIVQVVQVVPGRQGGGGVSSTREAGSTLLLVNGHDSSTCTQQGGARARALSRGANSTMIQAWLAKA
jgi:hypothetical protein